jgi:hypothetical protein
MTDGFSAIRASLESIGRGQNFFEWVQSFPLLLKDEPLSFKKHPELIQLYKDEHPNIVLRKGVQTGASTYAILKIFWRAAMMNRKGVYYGPTQEWISTFTPDRVDKIINQIPDVTRRLQGTDSIFLKDLGTVSVHFRGLETMSGVATVDADTIVVDEASIVNQDHRVITLDRLQHSSDPMRITLSKPEMPGQGIDADFNESDQTFYLFKCPKCGKWNNPVLSWPDCCFPVDPNSENGERYFGCTDCGARLDYDKAEWVPTYPSRKDTRGYQLSRIYWRFKNVATEMWRTWKKANSNAKKRRFFCGDVGVPYASDATIITDQILIMNQGSHGLQNYCEFPSFMGIDQGNTLHISIAHYEGHELAFHYYKQTESFKTLYKLIDKHFVQCAVIDAGPNAHPAKDFAEEFLGKVYLCYYTKNIAEKIGKLERNGVTIPMVTNNRDETLDALVDGVINGTVRLPRQNAGEVMDTVYTHLKNLVKVEKQGAYGPRKSYLRGNDHFGHSMNYTLMAAGLPSTVVYGLPLLPVGASFFGKGGAYDN